MAHTLAEGAYVAAETLNMGPHLAHLPEMVPHG
jgi:hypothetical protein